MSQNRQFVTLFNELVRNGPLKETVNLQEAGFAAGKVAEATPEGQPMDLNPLYTFIIERQNPKDATQQTFMALLERMREIGIMVREPDEIARLTDSQRSGHLRRYQRYVTRNTTGTYAKQPVQQEGAPVKPAKAKNPNARGQGKAPNRNLLIALGAVLVVGGGAIAFSQIDKLPTAEPVHVVNPRALQCDQLLGNPPTLICTMKKAAFERVDRDIQAGRAQETLKTAGDGYQRVHVQAPDGFPLQSYIRD